MSIKGSIVYLSVFKCKCHLHGHIPVVKALHRLEQVKVLLEGTVSAMVFVNRDLCVGTMSPDLPHSVLHGTGAPAAAPTWVLDLSLHPHPLLLGFWYLGHPMVLTQPGKPCLKNKPSPTFFYEVDHI